MFDYLIYRKPLVLFAPDLAEYEKKRGFYLDYRKMPFPVVEDGTQLAETIRGAAQEWKKHEKEIEDFIYLYTGSCDGNATERILELAGLERQIQ